VIGLAAALVVLLVAFGSLVAAGLPLAVALFGLGVSAPLTGVLAQVATVPDWAPLVAAMIGLGVGIDYALLVLTRFRASLAAGNDTRAAVAESVTTAGRSALVAGSTVIVSMLGLFLMGLDYMNGVALSASLAVLVMMLGALTLLPALLSVTGPRVNRLRLPVVGRRLAAGLDGGGGFAERWSRSVQRRPWVALVGGLALVAVLAVPILGMRLGFPDAGNDAQGSHTRTTYDLVAEGFGPGSNGPLLVAADVPVGTDRAELRAVTESLREVPGVAGVAGPEMSPDGSAALINVIPATAPADDRTEELVHELRGTALPEALGSSGIETSVGGLTAMVIDQGDYVGDRLPLFVGGVVVLSLLLLLAAFRAPVIALKAGAMNMLSIAAAYGITALFAQGGFFGELVGIDTEVPIPPFMPVMMFAILFGLSMDYEVFLISRIRELYLRTGDTASAVAEGLARSARVITAAAAIMIVVFCALAAADDVIVRLMGIGMAAAILVDATIVRMVLVPAAMQLLGRANWWIPSWLDRRLPRLDGEPGLRVGLREQAGET
jgi:RND superfamily putative drug exporter